MYLILSRFQWRKSTTGPIRCGIRICTGIGPKLHNVTVHCWILDSFLTGDWLFRIQDPIGPPPSHIPSLPGVANKELATQVPTKHVVIMWDYTQSCPFLLAVSLCVVETNFLGFIGPQRRADFCARLEGERGRLTKWRLDGKIMCSIFLSRQSLDLEVNK